MSIEKSIEKLLKSVAKSNPGGSGMPGGGYNTTKKAPPGGLPYPGSEPLCFCCSVTRSYGELPLFYVKGLSPGVCPHGDHDCFDMMGIEPLPEAVPCSQCMDLPEGCRAQ